MSPKSMNVGILFQENATFVGVFLRLVLRRCMAYTKGIYKRAATCPRADIQQRRPRRRSCFATTAARRCAFPVEFELPGEKVLISREGDRLVIEPVRKPGLTALLAQWAKEPPLDPEDDFPEIYDTPVKSEDIF